MGCAQCYTSHAQEADTLIARSQPGMTHVGRHPLTPAPTPPIHGEDMSKDKTGKGISKIKITRTPTKLTLEELQEALRAAVAKEDYEKAAKLRDKISAQNSASK
jgi:protein-arginine kinase activator protein McsA